MELIGFLSVNDENTPGMVCPVFRIDKKDYIQVISNDNKVEYLKPINISGRIAFIKNRGIKDIDIDLNAGSDAIYMFIYNDKDFIYDNINRIFKRILENRKKIEDYNFIYLDILMSAKEYIEARKVLVKIKKSHLEECCNTIVEWADKEIKKIDEILKQS